ncbi:MAG: hypothetical protein ACK5Z2_03570 [Bacteroidota bacterium]|jgi:hypothetical protein
MMTKDRKYAGRRMITIPQGWGKTLLYPFTRYGFGEQFFNFTHGIAVILILLFSSVGVTYIRVYMGDKVPVFEFMNDNNDSDDVSKQKNSFSQDGILSQMQSSVDVGSTYNTDPDKKRVIEKRAAKKREKIKAEFKKHLISLYIFVGLYFTFILWHRARYKRRQSPDSYDYSRHSEFDGESWPFMLFISIHVRQYLLYARYIIKTILIYIVFAAEYATSAARFNLSRRSKKKVDGKSQSALMVSEFDKTENPKPNEEKIPIFPKLKISLHDMRSYADNAHLSVGKVLECLVEPSILVFLGRLQISTEQYFGYVFVATGIALSLGNFVAYILARKSVLDNIDEHLVAIAMKEIHQERKAKLEQYGFRFRAPEPSNIEVLENLSPYAGKEKKRFVVT